MSLFGNTQSKGNSAATGGADIHDLIGSSTVQESSARLLPGNYLLQVDLFKTTTSKKNGHTYFIAEFDIVESSNPERPVGTHVGWARDLNGNFPEANAGECKSLIAATLNADPKDVDSETSRAAVSPQNPAKGRLVRCEAFKKDPDKDFVSTRFVGVPEEIQEKHKNGASSF